MPGMNAVLPAMTSFCSYGGRSRTPGFWFLVLLTHHMSSSNLWPWGHLPSSHHQLAFLDVSFLTQG